MGGNPHEYVVPSAGCAIFLCAGAAIYLCNRLNNLGVDELGSPYRLSSIKIVSMLKSRFHCAKHGSLLGSTCDDMLSLRASES